jgi:hypothetical protein
VWENKKGFLQSAFIINDSYTGRAYALAKFPAKDEGVLG